MNIEIKNIEVVNHIYDFTDLIKILEYAHSDVDIIPLNDKKEIGYIYENDIQDILEDYTKNYLMRDVTYNKLLEDYNKLVKKHKKAAKIISKYKNEKQEKNNEKLIISVDLDEIVKEYKDYFSKYF